MIGDLAQNAASISSRLPPPQLRLSQPGETAQYVMQDPEMAEIFGLFRRIDAAGDCHARADAAVALNYRRAGHAVMTVERFLALVR